MSNNIHNQDKKIEKIHKEEYLDDENNYEMEETLSDSDLSEEEEENNLILLNYS